MTLFETSLLGYLAIGFAIGALYFLGLWWTVRRLKRSRRPTVLTLASFLSRAALVLVVFYLAAQGRWERFLGCLAGFLLARVVITRRLRPRAPEQPRPTADPLTTERDG